MSRAMGCWRGRSYCLPRGLAFTPEFLLLRDGSAAGVGPSQHQPGPAVPRARPRRMVLKALFMVPAVSDLSFVNGWQPGSVLSPCYVGQSEDRLVRHRTVGRRHRPAAHRAEQDRSDRRGRGGVHHPPGHDRLGRAPADPRRLRRCQSVRLPVFVMTAKTINRRVKAAAQAAGLGEVFSGHSAGWGWPGGWTGPALRTRRSCGRADGTAPPGRRSTPGASPPGGRNEGHEPAILWGGWQLTGVCKSEIIATNCPRHPWIPDYAGMTEWAR